MKFSCFVDQSWMLCGYDQFIVALAPFNRSYVVATYPSRNSQLPFLLKCVCDKWGGLVLTPTVVDSAPIFACKAFSFLFSTERIILKYQSLNFAVEGSGLNFANICFNLDNLDSKNSLPLQKTFDACCPHRALAASPTALKPVVLWYLRSKLMT